MILDEIVRYKKEELEKRKKELPVELLNSHIELSEPPRNFKAALRQPGMSLIAEIKKASPSAGTIREDFNLREIAESYEQDGAAAISVLTESKYFQGSLDYLRKVRRIVTVPLLRKDFILDAYQIYESRACGADAILLIISLLGEKLDTFLKVASNLGMDALVEIHNEVELKIALDKGAQIIGINNRDLKTLKVDPETCLVLAPLIPEEIVTVAESGIHKREDVVKLEKLNVDAVLIGEALMRSPDIGAKIRELLGT